jgi:nuclear cap-binding protein subunit 1
MAIETILQLGSRSFSHFLNATERYLDLLRFLTPDPASRQLLLSGVSSYWKLSQQMQLITIDKYVQYGVLEGLDIVDWVFSEGEGTGAGADEADGWTDGHKWEILRMCLDKHSGRVASVKRRLRAVERADEAARARRAADVLEKGGDVGEEDIEVEGKLVGFACRQKLIEQMPSPNGPTKLETPKHPSISTQPAWKKSSWQLQNTSSPPSSPREKADYVQS